MPGTKNLRCSWNESGERGLTCQPTLFFREDVKKLIFFVIEDVHHLYYVLHGHQVRPTIPTMCISLTYLNVHHVQYQNCLRFHFAFQAILEANFEHSLFYFFV